MHTFVEGVNQGMGYAYRVDGPREPVNGHRFDSITVIMIQVSLEIV